MIDDEKRALRTRVLAARDAIPAAERDRASQQICRTLNGIVDECLARYGRPLTAAVYAAIGSEVALRDTVAHLYAAGSCVAFPAMVRGLVYDQRMQMRAVEERDLAAHAVPFIEHPVCPFEPENPEQDARFPVVEPSRLDLLIVPLVAFDSANMRLGYGGGCYDRFLPALSPACRVVGAAFAGQHVEQVPADEHDLPLPEIISA